MRHIVISVAIKLGTLTPFFMPANAQMVDEYPEIIVTGSRLPENEDNIKFDIVESEQINRYSSSTILTSLDQEAGVRSFNNGGAGGGSFLSIRGGEPNFTQVIIEGIKLNDPTNTAGGAFDFAQIDPLAVKSVEVADMGTSAFTGSDGLSGAVHIRLQNPIDDGPLLSATAYLESKNSYNAGAATRIKWNNGGLLASGGIYSSGDLFEGSALQRHQGLVRLVQQAAPITADLVLLAAFTDRTAFPEDSGGVQLAVNREQEKKKTDMFLIGTTVVGDEVNGSTPRFSISWSRQVSDVDTPAIAPGVFDGVPAIRSTFSFDRLEFTGDIRTEINDPLQIAIGVSYLQENGRGDSEIDFGFPLPASFEITRKTVSAFTELRFQPYDWFELNGALRVDESTSADSEVSYRFTGRIKDSERDWLLRFTAAENFHLPSLFALAFPLTANPELDAERGLSLELSVEKVIDENIAIEVALFRSKFTNLIDFDPILFTTVNRTKVITSGIETSLAAQLSSELSVSGSIAYLKINSPTRLRSRPDWQASLALDYSISEEIQIFARARYASSFLNSSIPTGFVEIDGRAILDTGASWHLPRGLKLSVMGRNVTSSSYQEAVGVPEPGAVYRVGLSYGYP